MDKKDEKDWPDIMLLVALGLLLACVVGLMAAGVYFAWKSAINA